MSTPAPGGPSAPGAPPVCYRHTGRETWIRCQRCDRPICPDCMRSAAVGFQCPTCVKEGTKSTRQARTPYGGRRVGDPRLTTFALIGINAMVWLAIVTTGGARSALVNALALTPDWGARELASGEVVAVRGVSEGAWWQVVTSMFTHVEVWHLALNMLALYMLGPVLENVLGRTRFLALYLVSGLAGSAAVMLFSHPNGATLGASGAIFGLMGALAVMALKVRGQLQSVLTLVGLNLVITFTVPSISWQGHLGGLLGGALVGTAMIYAPRQQRSMVQWSVTAAVLVISVVAILARVTALDSASPFQAF